jgi:DNA-binding HxlR family transcriptional regulator
MMWPEFRSACPVASALDIVGDKWTLVVLRTIFAGRHRFGELAQMPETIATNILADRLERLEHYGLVTKSPYQENPTRYQYGPASIFRTAGHRRAGSPTGSPKTSIHVLRREDGPIASQRPAS